MNPLVAQGSINRIRGTFAPVLRPDLIVTAPFLMKAGIRLALNGNTTTYLETMTGAVTSLEPYMMVTATIALVKTTPLVAVYQRAMQTNSLIGDAILTPDSKAMSPYQLRNCSIQNVAEQSFAGDDGGFVVSIGGYYSVNASLYAGV